MQNRLENRLKQKASDLGFHKVGIVNLREISQPMQGNQLARDRLQDWLSQSYQASMEWMTEERRQAIQSVMPQAQSVISLAMNYYTPIQREEGNHLAKISRYGWGRDYHKVMTKRLKVLATWLETQGANHCRFYVDTGPVQEKAWAQQAGLGWVGKHSNLITRDYGSWVFLSEVITDLDLPSDSHHTSHCGTCTRCMEACPTDAIAAPYVVDANRCIAYQTIENRAEDIPVEIAQNMQGWVAGCDICQDVCPWNQRFAQETDIEDFQPYPWNVNPSLAELADLSPDDWDQRFRASALRRIRVDMMRRNARANLDHPLSSDR